MVSTPVAIRMPTPILWGIVAVFELWSHYLWAGKRRPNCLREMGDGHFSLNLVDM